MIPINFCAARKIKMLLLVVVGLISFVETSVRIKLTKMECNVTDPDFARVDWCILKPESRNVQSVKARFTAFQVPVNDFELNVQLMKRLSGWKPFLYDVTVNCSTVRHLNKLTGLVWQHIQNVTNIRNRFCPITQTVYETLRVDNIYVENTLRLLPVPLGDYGILATIATQGKIKMKGFVGGTVF